jgi:hypothetical protein
MAYSMNVLRQGYKPKHVSSIHPRQLVKLNRPYIAQNPTCTVHSPRLGSRPNAMKKHLPHSFRNSAFTNSLAASLYILV